MIQQLPLGAMMMSSDATASTSSFQVVLPGWDGLYDGDVHCCTAIGAAAGIFVIAFHSLIVHFFILSQHHRSTEALHQ